MLFCQILGVIFTLNTICCTLEMDEFELGNAIMDDFEDAKSREAYKNEVQST